MLDRLPADRVLLADDEKSALEQAVGMAAAGIPTCWLAKGVGVSHAWDAITNAAVHGTLGGAALVLVAADDVDASGSTVVLDARALAATADLTVLEACTLDQVDPVVGLAAAVSVSIGEPVLVRLTRALTDLRRGPTPPDLPAMAAGPSVDEARHRAHATTKWGRDHLRRRDRLPVVADVVDRAGLVVERHGPGGLVVLGVGAAWSAAVAPVADELDLPALGTGAVVPLPRAVVDRAGRAAQVLVVEEGEPVVETALTVALHRAGARTEVRGRGDGALPPTGRRSPADVRRAVGRPADRPEPAVWKGQDPPVPAAPYDDLFTAVLGLRRRSGVAVTACVGTVVDLAAPPRHGVDIGLALGAATATAAGMARAGRPVVALTGDAGLLHSGLNGYAVAQREGLPVLTVIVHNGVSRRTGSQPTSVHPDVEAPLDLVAVLHAHGGRRVGVIRTGDIDAPGLEQALVEALDDLPATIVLDDLATPAR